jgi:predicted ATPase
MVITIATEQGLSFYLGILTAVRGWALARQGSTAAGLAQIEQGIALYRANVGEHIVLYLLALLAETQSNMGRSQDASQSLTAALALAEKNGEHFYDAELYRLKGQLTLQSRQVEDKSQTSHGQVEGKSEDTNTQHLAPSTQAEAEAEACFHKAIEIARKQQAKSLELRAVMSLACLWQQQGKQKEAHERLAEVYGWFTEGFDTADLQEAKALLEELVEQP